MTVAVWDERDDYTACTWRSMLMVIIANGFTAFPLGAYTVDEARAFRAGDGRLNFSGPVERALSRYGIAVQSPAPYSQAGLREALSTPGRAYAVAGRTANFPAGHPIRRWDPVFSGFHAVCVIPLGEGNLRWLDPLAYTGFAGDVVTVSDVVDTFALGNYPNDARYLPTMLGANMTTVTITKYAQPRQASIAAGATVQGWNATSLIESMAFPTGSSFMVDADVVIEQSPPQAPEGLFRRGQNGVFAGLYVPSPQVSVAPEPPAPVVFTQTQLDKAVADAIAALPAPVPAPTPSVDVAGALAALNAMPTQTNRISLARSEIIRLKNLAKAKLGG